MLTTVQSTEPVATAPVRSPIERFYYPQLDGLRSLAFCLVFGSHAGGFDASHMPFFLQAPVLCYNNLVSYGWCGVDLFFVLSAFLITSLLLREERLFHSIDYRSFVIRRALRIWPLYFLMVFVGMAMIPLADPAVVSAGMKARPGFFTTYVLTNFAWALTFTLNLGVAWGKVFVPADMMPLWSISLEEQFYVVWPWCLKTVHSKALRLSLPFIALAACIWYRSHLMAAYPDNHVPYYLGTLSRLDPLIVGSVIAFTAFYYPAVIQRCSRHGYLWFVASAMLFELNVACNPHMFEQHNPFALTGFALGWGLFLIGMLTWAPAIRMFSGKLLSAFGRLTYGMYVVHALVLNLIYNQMLGRLGYKFPSNESVSLALFLGLPVTFVLAWALWNGYEKRFHSLKDRFARVKSGFPGTQAKSSAFSKQTNAVHT